MSLSTAVPSASAATRPPARAGSFPVPPFAAPLFRDPVTDGAADPTVIRHHETGEWWMYYTRRGPDDTGPGVSWVHGTRIGVARSPDGRTWHAAGLVDGLDAASTGCSAATRSAVAPSTAADTAADTAAGSDTHWAPEVIHDGTAYRLYLSVVDGVPDRWEGHPRRIVEYRSTDLERWTRIRDLSLSSDRVIDACVAHCPDGLWRLWYKDEAHDSTTWVASSPDLGDEHEWHGEGEAEARVTWLQAAGLAARDGMLIVDG